MAAAMDLRDDPGGIHPRTKTDVGYRLSRAGLAVAYGHSIEYQGPIATNFAVGIGSATIDIGYTRITGIEFRNSDGFEVNLDFLFLINKINFFKRYVVKEHYVQMIINGYLQQLHQKIH
jgi:hypothetical protein